MEESSSSESIRDVSANASTSTIFKDEINIPLEKKNDVDLDEYYYSFKEVGDPIDYNNDGDDLFDEYGYDDDADYDIDNMVTMFEDIDLSTGVEVAFNDLDAVNENDEVAVKFKSFKKFDSVSDPSDHHFCSPKLLNIKGAGMQPTKKWTRRIQHEWRLLEKSLPETIYVRIYEGRLDLLRAVIVGPAGTPYHDGLFFFDIYFPTHYPSVPPSVHYHSRGLRLNPNLYATGNVCLSLLNTWTGQKSEQWRAGSTMLQVLVSIQGLILNEKPFFNEPGFEGLANTTRGERSSLAYNNAAFILSCKTMLYSLQNPPKHFESFVEGHFRYRGRAILMACIAYLRGAQIGCPAVPKREAVAKEDPVEATSQVVAKEDDSNSSTSETKTETGTALHVEATHRRCSTFLQTLSRIFEQLLMEFTVCGADCQIFHSQKAKKEAAKAASEQEQH